MNQLVSICFMHGIYLHHGFLLIMFAYRFNLYTIMFKGQIAEELLIDENYLFCRDGCLIQKLFKKLLK